MVTDASGFFRLRPVPGETFAKGVVTPDDQASAGVGWIPPDILWRRAKRGRRPDRVGLSHGHRPRQIAVGDQVAPIANVHRPDRAVDDAIWPDDHIVTEAHLALNDGRCMYCRGQFRHVGIVSSPLPMTLKPLHLDVRNLGRMPYGEALTLQRSIQQEVIAARKCGGHAGVLLLLEHEPPVITVSRRASAASHLLATPETLRAAGVEVCDTDRGGDITYHGPGQLVVYPILDLNRLGLRLHGYMRWLEDRVIEALAHFGVAATRDKDATGVWIGTNKICALGVRVSRWVSMHGLALNVDPDLSHFDLIVPCGLHGRGITSLRRELGEACPDMEAVKEVLCDGFDAAR